MTHSPIIIIGMHRSGTSLISELLEDLGLFIGQHKDRNHEAMFFRRTNQWLLEVCGGQWYNPEPFDQLLEHPSARPLTADFLRFLLKTPRAANYLGWGNYLRLRDVGRMNAPWGWKDPRNTYTLPLWMDLFPQAKVVHIYRNGVDAANSLYTRSAQRNLRGLSRWQRLDRRIGYALLSIYPNIRVNDFSLEACFALWERYTTKADAQIASLPPERTFVLRYEDFLQSPQPFLRELCDFTGVAANAAQIERASSKVKPERGSAYERDETLRTFYESVKDTPQMARYGYGTAIKASSI